MKSQNYDIAVIDRSRNTNFKNVTNYIGDICDYSFVEKAISDFQPSKVFHLAAYKKRSSTVEDMSKALKVNLIGTLNIYQALLNVPAFLIYNKCYLKKITLIIKKNIIRNFFYTI